MKVPKVLAVSLVLFGLVHLASAQVTTNDLKNAGQANNKVYLMAVHAVHTINSDPGGILWGRLGTVTYIQTDLKNGVENMDAIASTNFSYDVGYAGAMMYESLALFDVYWNQIGWGYIEYPHNGFRPSLQVMPYWIPFGQNVREATVYTKRVDGAAGLSYALTISQNGQALVWAGMPGNTNATLQVVHSDGTIENIELSEPARPVTIPEEDTVGFYRCKPLIDEDIIITSSWGSPTREYRSVKGGRRVINVGLLRWYGGDEPLRVQATVMVLLDVSTGSTEKVVLRGTVKKPATYSFEADHVYLVSFEAGGVDESRLWDGDYGPGGGKGF